jgi:hypothetical protein
MKLLESQQNFGVEILDGNSNILNFHYKFHCISKFRNSLLLNVCDIPPISDGTQVHGFGAIRYQIHLNYMNILLHFFLSEKFEFS